MSITKSIMKTVALCIVSHAIISCNGNSKTMQTDNSTMVKKSNPVVYFEIPVTDIDRAIRFYEAVFHFKFGKEMIDHNEMAIFPFAEENTGISGALAKGEIYKPTKDGVLIYFVTESIDETLKLATSNGGQVLYPKTDNGIGFVA